MRRHLWLVPLLAASLVGCSSAAGPSRNKQEMQAPAAASEPAPGATALTVPQPGGTTGEAAAGEASARGLAVGSPSVRTGSVPIDLARLKQLQAEVDAGHMPGSLDPLDVFYTAAPTLGLTPGQDTVRLEHQSTAVPSGGLPTAHLYVLHDGEEYIAELIQPVRTGQTGIWAVNSLRSLGPLAENEQKLEAVRSFFQAAAGQDWTAASRLLAPRLRQSLAADEQGLAGGIRFDGVERVAWLSPGPDVLYVTIHLHLEGTPPGAWREGENVRYITLIQENGQWLVASIAASL